MRKGQMQIITKVIKYIKKYMFFILLSLGCAVITVVFSLYIPILTGNAIDLIIGKNNVDMSNSKPSKDSNNTDNNNYDDSYDDNYVDGDNYVDDNDDNYNDGGGNTPDDPSDMFDNPDTVSPTKKPESTRPPVATIKPEITKPPVATKEPEVDDGTTPGETDSPTED